jgi:HEAT repeat protein
LNAAYCLSRLGTNAEQAIPALIAAVDDKDDKVAAQAVSALSDLRLKRDITVPALSKALKDSRPVVRMAAVYAVRSFEEDDARTTVPVLTALLRDEFLCVRQAATNMLNELAPEQ